MLRTRYTNAEMAERNRLTDEQIETLAREMVDDPNADEFSIAVGYEDFVRVQIRADQIEGESP